MHFVSTPLLAVSTLRDLRRYRVPTLAEGSHKQCTVVFEYDARADDELSIKVGEAVKVYQVSEDGWVEVRLQFVPDRKLAPTKSDVSTT